jgi:hypothetical protein
MVKEESKKPSFKLTHFIDTKPETFSTLKIWLEELKNDDHEIWTSNFPIELK